MVLAALAACAVPWPARAAPRDYVLDAAASEVAFSYVLEGVTGRGTMPIDRADLTLDFERAANSSAEVTLDAAGARTGVFFVTEALKGRSVLNTADHPKIRFRSRDFAARDGGATITGDVTIRGVTRPLTLEAEIFRRAGSELGDLSRLTVRLTGAVNRSDFGATGYADLVANRVGLEITARLSRRG